MDFCLVCGRPLERKSGPGRPRLYCSDACRKRAWRRRQQQRRRDERQVVVIDGRGLYRQGAAFSWGDFRLTLEEGLWPEGMRVRWRSQTFRVVTDGDGGERLARVAVDGAGRNS